MNTWHAPTDILTRLAADPATVDEPEASSVEAHLIACAACRSALAGVASRLEAGALDRSWDAVADRIDRPRLSVIERLLNRLGVRADLARVAASSPALQLAWLAAIGFVGMAAVMVSRIGNVTGPFLVIAPLVPLVAVAATFAPASDPAGEAGVATPLHGPGLVVRRAAVVLVPTFVALAAGTVALPGFGPGAAAWVLPALALALGTLACGTRWRVEVAAGTLALAWLVGVGLLALGNAERPVGELAVFAAPGQFGAFLAATAATFVLFRRSHLYATLEVGR